MLIFFLHRKSLNKYVYVILDNFLRKELCLSKYKAHNLGNVSTFAAILKILLPQCIAIPVRTPPRAIPSSLNFMKGNYKSNPPVPRHRTTWDVTPVLSYLSSLPEASELSLKFPTLKLTNHLNYTFLRSTRAEPTYARHTVDWKGYLFEFAFPVEHINQSRPGYKVPSVLLQA